MLRTSYLCVLVQLVHAGRPAKTVRPTFSLVKEAVKQSQCCPSSDGNCTDIRTSNNVVVHDFVALDYCDKIGMGCCAVLFNGPAKHTETERAYCDGPQNSTGTDPMTGYPVYDRGTPYPAWGVIADYSQWLHGGFSSGLNIIMKQPSTLYGVPTNTYSSCNAVFHDWDSANMNIPTMYFPRFMYYAFVIDVIQAGYAGFTDPAAALRAMGQDWGSDPIMGTITSRPTWARSTFGTGYPDAWERDVTDSAVLAGISGWPSYSAMYKFYEPGYLFANAFNATYGSVPKTSMNAAFGWFDTCDKLNFWLTQWKVRSEFLITFTNTTDINECWVEFYSVHGRVWDTGIYSVREVTSGWPYPNTNTPAGANVDVKISDYEFQVPLPNGTKYIATGAPGILFLGEHEIRLLSEYVPFGAHGFHKANSQMHTSYVSGQDDWPTTAWGYFCDPTCPARADGSHPCGQHPPTCTLEPDNPNLCKLNSPQP